MVIMIEMMRTVCSLQLFDNDRHDTGDEQEDSNDDSEFSNVKMKIGW